jgi:hypothetical protein
LTKDANEKAGKPEDTMTAERRRDSLKNIDEAFRQILLAFPASAPAKPYAFLYAKIDDAQADIQAMRMGYHIDGLKAARGAVQSARCAFTGNAAFASAVDEADMLLAALP